MMDFDTVAYLVLGLSFSASALQLGRWLLNADPRAIAVAGRWSVAGLFALAPLLLLWLTLTGRATLAMMLAAFILPIAVPSARRWRGLSRLWAPIRDGLGERFGDPGRRRNPDPELVRRSAAVLQAYVEQSRLEQSRRGRMTAMEALAVLGLEPQAGAPEIREAHRRLRGLVAAERGGTRYLTDKIDEAREVLLGTPAITAATFEKGGLDHV